MSADNWADCPRCALRAQKKYEAALEALNEMYGKVPLDQFRKAQKAVHLAAIDIPTFREDYEIYGAENGTVKIGYSGGCTLCGLSVHFDHEVPIEGVNE